MRRKAFIPIQALAVLAAVLLLPVTGAAPARAEELAADWPPAASAGARSDEFRRVAETGELALDIRETTTEIAVRDKRGDTVWYSNPPAREDDELAVGINKMNLNSQLIVRYTNQTNQIFLTNNHTGSTLRGDYAIEYAQGAVTVRYRFTRDNERFEIPVRYSLDGGRFSAELLTGEIGEYGAARIVEIAFLPAFGAGHIDEEGFLLVPDGSGALINFNNGKEAVPQYSEYVYGRDPLLAKTYDNKKSETVRLPVLGIGCAGRGVVAAAGPGAAVCAVNAEVSRVSDSYNKAWFSLQYRLRDTTVMAEQDGSAKDVSIVSADAISLPALKITYLFTDGGGGYADMAAAYREHLADSGALPRAGDGGQYPFYATFTGAARRREVFLGIPVTRTKALTAYDELADAAADLAGRGVDDPVVLYSGWGPKGMNGAVPQKVRYESALGGKRAFRAMTGSLDGAGIPLYLGADFQNLHAGGLTPFFSAVKTISKAPALQYAYKPSTMAKDTGVKPWYLLRGDKAADYAASFAESAAAAGTGVYQETLGSLVYAEYRGSGLVDRQQAADLQRDTLAAAGAPMTLHAPNDYALAYAGHAIGLASGATGFFVCDEEVPFYPMVLHGLVSYAFEPANRQANPEDFLLRTAEYGASLNYHFTARSTDILKDTPYSGLYYTEYGLYAGEAAGQYARLRALLEPVAGRAMTGHGRVAEGVYRTLYDDGTAIYVNYTDAAYTDGGLTVEAGGWASQKEGGA